MEYYFWCSCCYYCLFDFCLAEIDTLVLNWSGLPECVCSYGISFCLAFVSNTLGQSGVHLLVSLVSPSFRNVVLFIS